MVPPSALLFHHTNQMIQRAPGEVCLRPSSGIPRSVKVDVLPERQRGADAVS
jgi:hypothetical protein